MKTFPGRLSRWFERQSLAVRFAIVAATFLSLVMLLLGSWVNHRIRAGVLQASAESAALYIENFLEPNIQELAEGKPISGEYLEKLRRVTENLQARSHIASIKIWMPDGTIAFSSYEPLIGQKFDIDEIEPALKGEVHGYLHALDDVENAYERSLNTSLYEVYAPLFRTDTREIIAVGEFYENAGRLDQELFGATLQTWAVVGASSLAMLLVLFEIVKKGSRTIAEQRMVLEKELAEQSRLHHVNRELRTEMATASREASRIDELVHRRLGADIHDGPAQLLTYVMLRLDELSDYVEDISEPEAKAVGKQVLADVEGAASSALAELRSIASGLFLAQADLSSDLTTVVVATIRSHEKRTGTKVEMITGEISHDVPKDVLWCVARVVQEALTNAYKHAEGRGQKVKLTDENGIIVIEVSDRGCGFDFDMVAREIGKKERLGLTGMKYRVESLGGTLTIGSLPGAGTIIRFTIPLLLKD